MSVFQLNPTTSIPYIPQFITTTNNTNTSNNDNNIAQQIFNNSIFKLMLKDMIQELLIKKQQQQKQQKEQEPKISCDIFMQQISDSLYLIAQTQTNKKIKEAEKFLENMYQHKVKQLQDKFQVIIQQKLKQLQQKLSQVESKTKIQNSLLSPIKPILKNKLFDLSVNDYINKRMQLKQKILNCSYTPQVRHSMNIQSVSMLSQSLNDANLQKLTQKVRVLEQNLKTDFKALSARTTNIKLDYKKQLQQTQTSIREQINSGFQGIWNVISNLEKRIN